MKNPFKRSKQTPAEYRGILAARLRAAEDDLAGARHDAVQTVLAGAGDAEQAGAEDRIHRCEVHVRTLEAALLALDVEIQEAEAVERAAVERKTREASAAALERLAADWDKAALPLPGVLSSLLDAALETQSILGPSPFAEFLGNLRRELPVAAEVASADLRARAKAILAGTARPEMPHKPELYVIDPTLPPLEKATGSKTYELPEAQRPQAYIPDRQSPDDRDQYGCRPCNDPPILLKSWPEGSGPDEQF